MRTLRMGVDVEKLQADYRYESLRLLRVQQFLFAQIGKIRKIQDVAKRTGIELELKK